jgi:MATE family multidrug resistance protein
LNNVYFEIKNISQDAFFIVLQQLAIFLRSFGLTWMLFNLGNAALGAGALVLSQYAVCTYFLHGLLTSVGITASNVDGSGKSELTGKYIINGLALAVIISLCVIVGFLMFRNLFPFFGQSTAVIPVAKSYINYLAWSLLPFSIFVVLQQYLLSTFQYKYVTLYSTLGVLAVLIIGYLFAFGKLIFPAMGIRGLGLGAIIAFSFISICSALHIMLAGKSRFHFHKNLLSLETKIIYELWQIGWPLGAKWAIEIGTFMVIAILIGRQSTIALASQQILLQLVLFSSAFSSGIDQATMIRSSHAFGGKKYKNVKMIGMAGIILGVIVAILYAITIITFPKLISYVFSNNPLMATITTLIPLVILFLIFDSFRTITTGLLASMKDVKFAFYVEIVTFWGIGLVSGFIISRFQTAIVSYWIGLIIAVLLCSLSLLTRFLRNIETLIKSSPQSKADNNVQIS